MRRASLPGQELLLLALMGACSDYDLAGTKAPNPPADDSASPEPEDEPPICDPIEPEPGAVPTDAACRAAPDIGVFDPVLEWAWTDNPIHPEFNQVMAAPAIGNLNDDNGDGRINEDDVPDIVFAAFSSSGAYTSAGAIVALSGIDGATLWSHTDLGGGVAVAGTSGVAIADVDGSGPSIFASRNGGVLRLDATGALLWNTPLDPASSYGYGYPAVGDMDGDGVAEIAVGPMVLAADGSVRFTGAADTGLYISFFMDLDQDGRQELIAGNTVYASDGSVVWDAPDDGYAAVADMDGDGQPEVLTVEVSGGQIVARHADGSELWRFDLDDLGGGPPTVADFDGDGLPEVGIASELWYRVVDTDGTELWRMPVIDASSRRTGSSVFDFEGDGVAEVVYADEETLWVFDGSTGSVELALTDHSSGTLFEYPIVADVDKDGAAEIIVASNDYSSHRDSRGIRVIGDRTGSWAAARPIWNQHAWSISNIRDDATVPPRPLPPWRSWNSFRAGNSETRLGLDLPDLRVGDPIACTDECADTGETELWLAFNNQGIAAADAVPAAIYRLDGSERSLITSVVLGTVPAGEERFWGPLRLGPEHFGSSGLLIRIDDNGVSDDHVEECHEANNSLVLPQHPCAAR